MALSCFTVRSLPARRRTRAVNVLCPGAKARVAVSCGLAARAFTRSGEDIPRNSWSLGTEDVSYLVFAARHLGGLRSAPVTRRPFSG